jgi:hypothetical protein
VSCEYTQGTRPTPTTPLQLNPQLAPGSTRAMGHTMDAPALTKCPGAPLYQTPPSRGGERKGHKKTHIALDPIGRDRKPSLPLVLCLQPAPPCAPFLIWASSEWDSQGKGEGQSQAGQSV